MQTPTKKVKRGRKPASECSDDFCRLCKCALKVKFGDFAKTSYISSENIFTTSATSKVAQTLQELLSDLGFLLEKSTNSSDRVCKACARKVRNAHELFGFIKTALLNVQEATREKDECYTDSQDDAPTNSTIRIKRQLPTTVCSPERSSQDKKVARTTKHVQTCAKSKKRLAFTQDITSEAQADDKFLSRLNIDEFLNKSTTQIKVVIVNPDKTVKSHSYFEDETKSLMLNLVRKNWSATANVIFKHRELRTELIAPLRRTIREEFTSYCNDESDSVLKAKSPVDVSSFSNKVLVHEVELACPFWQASLEGACKVTQSKKRNVKITNSMSFIYGFNVRDCSKMSKPKNVSICL